MVVEFYVINNFVVGYVEGVDRIFGSIVVVLDVFVCVVILEFVGGDVMVFIGGVVVEVG